MKSRINSIMGKFVRILFAFVLATSVVPMSSIKVVAETATHTGKVTLTVKDSDGGAIADADVSATLHVAGATDQELTLKTDATGTVDIMDGAAYDSAKVTNFDADITKDGFTAKQITSQAITSATQDVVVTLTYSTKMDQKLKFTNTIPTTKELNLTDTTKNVIDFAAETDGTNTSGKDITYAVVNQSSANTAVFSSTRPSEATFYNAGVFTVVATRLGNAYYNDATVYATVIVTYPAENIATFGGSEFSVTYNNSQIIDSTHPLTKPANDTGAITYSITSDNEYLNNKYDAYGVLSSGAVKGNIRAFNKAFQSVDTIKLMITGNKAAGTIDAPIYKADGTSVSQKGIVIYPAAQGITYTLIVSKNSPYDFATYCQITSPDSTTGWYNVANPAVIKLKDGVTGVQLVQPNDSNTEVSVTEIDVPDQTEDYYYFDILDTSDNKIHPVKTPSMIKVDKTLPSPDSITYGKSVTSENEFEYYNKDASVDFTGSDATSGLAKIIWTYESSLDTTKTESNSLDVKSGEDTATLALTATEANQYYGHLSFKVTDVAGNTSKNALTDTAKTIVLDTISPTATVSYNDAQYSKPDGSQLYYNGEIKGTIKMTEANFFADAVAVTIAKNGGKGQATTVTWDNSTTALHTGTFTIPSSTDHSADGDYVVTISYTDKSGNSLLGHKDATGKEVPDYVSSVMTIDTVAPTLGVKFSGSDTNYYNNAATATLSLTEKNFFPADVDVEVTKGDCTKYRLDNAKIVWDNSTTDLHTGVITFDAPADHSADQNYSITVDYTDKSKNVMDQYKSDTFILDTTKPTVNVEYANKNVVNTLADGSVTRKYFPATQTATVTITEHNFDATAVKVSIAQKDVTGADITTGNLYSISGWKDGSNDTHSIVITYPGDANYTFDVDYTDLAKNQMDDYAPDYFTVDKTAPENLKVSYSDSLQSTAVDAEKYDFYNQMMTVTISADDNTTPIHQFIYSYVKAAGVSTVNAELLKNAIDEAAIVYSNSNKTATATFQIPKSALTADNQFNGTVQFTAIDRSGNATDKTDFERIVVDNIAPTAEISYNEPLNKENDISYYDGSIAAKIDINEANFYASDVVVTAAKDGGAATAITPSWVDNSVDSHTGVFSLTDDGDYIVTVTYTDRSNNQMTTYTSNQLTIDTTIENPTITINGEDGNGRAYKDAVVPAVSFSDENYDNYQMTLTRTRNGDKDEDVTAKFLGAGVGANENGGSGSYDTFEKTADNDGIYTLTVNMTDKAGHSSTSTCVFTVNRFGSVYSYNDVLTKLIANGGVYTQSVSGDLVITEYNADRLVADSLKIEITRDGKPISNVKYTVSPVINDQVAVGASGWFQYEYTISKDNFASDGVYKISVSSADATGNTPENTNYDDKSILFRVDKTAPELTSVTGLEKPIINAQKVDVKYNAFDAIGLKSITILVDGKQVDQVTDFKKDLNNYDGTFTINENSNAQNVEIVIEDLAGNKTDTGAEDFKSEYAFSKSVTVSTNFFVRWFANKPLFFGSIAGIAALVGVIWFLLAKKKKNKEESAA